jgi:hypothetical protein
MADVTFLEQREPVDEYGRALYAVARSVIRALLDQLTAEDLTDLNTDRADVTVRQLAKVVRLELDKGMRGDGFEWAVHEAIMGGESSVIEPVAYAMGRASTRLKNAGTPTSLMFGHERARYLGFLEAVVADAGEKAVLLPDGSGRPFAFGPWVTIAAEGATSETLLGGRIRKVWKTDLFLGVEGSYRYAAATIKSNWRLLEDGPGLRIGIVPEHKDLRARYDRRGTLHLAVLPDPDGFMGMFNDAYSAVARAVLKIGKQPYGVYYEKPSAKAERLQAQLEKYPEAKVLDVEDALNEAAQQHLIGVERKLLSVDAPPWLHLPERTQTPVLAPRPKFEPLD